MATVKDVAQRQAQGKVRTASSTTPYLPGADHGYARPRATKPSNG